MFTGEQNLVLVHTDVPFKMIYEDPYEAGGGQNLRECAAGLWLGTSPDHALPEEGAQSCHSGKTASGFPVAVE